MAALRRYSRIGSNDTGWAQHNVNCIDRLCRPGHNNSAAA
jgi:hypothetical protein